MDDDSDPRDDAGTDDAAAQHTRRAHAHTVLKVVLSTQLVLALITMGGVWLAYNHLNGKIADGKRIFHADGIQDVAVDGPHKPLNILVLGSDSRAGKDNIDGLGDIGERSDTTILLHVSADRRTAYGVSLPRDALIDRPDCRVDDDNGGTKMISGQSLAMFNTAFAVGGAQCAQQTVEALTHIRIDHFIVVDFSGFKDMVDAIDGVEVCIPKEIDDSEHHIHFDAGVQTLKGQQALNYVRGRTGFDPTADIGRMKRQQAFIASMINKVKSAGTLSQPSRVYGFIDAVASSIKVDSGLDSVGKLFDLAMQFKDTGLDHIQFVTVPFAEYEPDPNRLVWTSDAEVLWKRIIHDKPLGKRFSGTSVRAGDKVGSPTDSPDVSPDATDESDAADDESGEPPTSPGTSDPEQLTEEQEAARRAAGLCT